MAPVGCWGCLPAAWAAAPETGLAVGDLLDSLKTWAPDRSVDSLSPCWIGKMVERGFGTFVAPNCCW